MPYLFEEKREPCEICGRTHDIPGAYTCTQCGQFVCVGQASSNYPCTEKVIGKHFRKVEGANVPVQCGPAIRLAKLSKTRIKISK